MIGKHAALAADLDRKHAQRMAKLSALHSGAPRRPAPAVEEKPKAPTSSGQVRTAASKKG